MKILCTTLALLALVSGAALAEPEFPRLYDVIGVDGDDVLNLRAAPSSDAEVIGDLPPDTTGIEAIAVSDNGFWLQVALPESMGWAAAGYMKAWPRDPDALFARSLQCGGTEPFWGLTITQGEGALLTRMELPDTELPAGKIRPAQSAGRFFLDLGKHHAALISAESCSDGMSDRIRGLSISLAVDGSKAMNGCCSVIP